MKSFALLSIFLLASLSQSQLDINIYSNSSIKWGYVASDLTLEDARLYPSSSAIPYRDSAETPQYEIVFPANVPRPTPIQNAKWIGPQASLNVAPITIFTTSCFANVCPRNKFTLNAYSTCKFKVYFINVVTNQIVSPSPALPVGNPWTFYQWSFTLPCGRYRAIIVAYCKNPYLYFSLTQATGCFNCPDSLRHTYNMSTCSCECANQCTCPTTPAKSWSGYPNCTCQCNSTLACPFWQYWDKKSCSCVKTWQC